MLQMTFWTSVHFLLQKGLTHLLSVILKSPIWTTGKRHQSELDYNCQHFLFSLFRTSQNDTSPNEYSMAPAAPVPVVQQAAPPPQVQRPQPVNRPKRETAEEINRRWFGITSEDEEDDAGPPDPQKEQAAWDARRKARETMDREIEEMRQRVSFITVFVSNLWELLDHSINFWHLWLQCTVRPHLWGFSRVWLPAKRNSKAAFDSELRSQKRILGYS